MNKKGLIFSLDALFSLLIIGVAVLFVIININQTNVSADSQFLHKSAIDILSVLREDSSLEILDNTSINSFFDSLPGQLCVNLTVYDSDSLILYNNLKSGCNSTGSTTGISRRVFLANSSVNMGELEVWYE